MYLAFSGRISCCVTVRGLIGNLGRDEGKIGRDVLKNFNNFQLKMMKNENLKFLK